MRQAFHRLLRGLTWTAVGAVVSATLTLALFAGGCDPAWDGPGFLEQGYESTYPPEDVSEGADVEPSGPDIVEPQDVGGPADVPPIDIPQADDVYEPDIPQPDVHGPDVPQILGCEAPEGALNPFAELHLSGEATPGWGIDLDGDPDTCHPVKLGCEHGIDNSLAAVAPLLEPIVQELMGKSEGPLFAVQHLTDDPDAAPYDIAGWTLTAAEGDDCHSPETCTITLHSENDEGACEPSWVIENALVLEDQVLVAGRPDSKHTLRVNIGGNGAYRNVDLFAVQIRALVTREGDTITGLSGVIGGAIRYTDLLVLIGLVPEEFFDVDLTPDYLIEYLNFLEYLSGTPLTDYFLPDGSGHAVSFAFTFEAFAADAVSGDMTDVPLELVP